MDGGAADPLVIAPMWKRPNLSTDVIQWDDHFSVSYKQFLFVVIAPETKYLRAHCDAIEYAIRCIYNNNSDLDFTYRAHYRASFTVWNWWPYNISLPLFIIAHYGYSPFAIAFFYTTHAGSMQMFCTLINSLLYRHRSLRGKSPLFLRCLARLLHTRLSNRNTCNCVAFQCRRILHIIAAVRAPHTSMACWHRKCWCRRNLCRRHNIPMPMSSVVAAAGWLSAEVIAGNYLFKCTTSCEFSLSHSNSDWLVSVLLKSHYICRKVEYNCNLRLAPVCECDICRGDDWQQGWMRHCGTMHPQRSCSM